MMCSRLLQKMENFQGDLTDILRAGNSVAPPAEQGVIMSIPEEWQFPDKDLLGPILVHDQESLDEFGDPFSSLRDPLLLHHPSPAFFTTNTSTAPPPSSSSFCSTNIISDEEAAPPPQTCKSSNAGNMFSTMLQISPSTAKFPISAPPISSPVLLANESVNKKAVESGGPAAPQQISPPRTTGMKRRKSQAKKVVCIPAPAPANSRPSGEIVPSDLWAWRKYGQKPIKGSPYPRGYYRCSSSKGCSARKQVERSRTDPNMLVITYTSEHNHPWPTQRNALAGSTRNPPTKAAASTSKPPAAVKEEAPAMKEEMEMERGDLQSYRPGLPDSNHAEDFFADLGELEADPLSLLFAKGGYGNGESGDQEEQQDSFSFYDWVNSAATTDAAGAGGHKG